MQQSKRVQTKFVGSLVAIMVAASGCTQPGETTGYAAATGGVIGAGLGAIVGSQVGSAGAGVAIGAAAGTGAGYAIGNAIEGNEKKLAVQEERLNRQEETLRAQRNELDNLKTVERDSYRSSGDSYAMNRANTGGGGVARYATATEIAAARNSVDRKDYGRAQLNTNTLRAPSTAPTLPEKSRSIAPAAALGATAAASTGASSIKEKNLIDAPTASIDASGKEELHHTAPAESQPNTVAQPASLNNSQPAAGCTNGDEELAKASAATDSADKLFHIRRALRLCPDNASYHVQLSELYTTMNRSDDARFELQEALKLDPSHSAAKEKLEALQRGTMSNSIAEAKQPKLPGRY
jgi:tetratricopeptide (TPR) repeat protein